MAMGFATRKSIFIDLFSFATTAKYLWVETVTTNALRHAVPSLPEWRPSQSARGNG
jgi:hypothetical protein